ncbi:hypothetical protein PVAND_017642 [Polypedilum vanderplanki]|nr:hypothetical protein PVAND_017642 [Polypedilum vanderplanki]
MSTVKLPPTDCPLASHDFIHRFSNSIKHNWSKLIRATARALKFYYNAIIPLAKSLLKNDKSAWLKVKNENEAFQILTADDLERAELFIIRKMQHDILSCDIKLLKKGLPVKNKNLAQLNVFLDDQDIIRINSRVVLDPAIYPQRFSPVAPREHPLSTIFLFHIHEKFNHVCLESQIADVRAKYWLPRVRVELKKIKSTCNHCGYRRANRHVPIMAPLPTCRIDPTLRPFQVTAVDCTGALMVYNHTKKTKMYLLLFTCTLTRFVYVHIVEKLDTLNVLEAITQFWTGFGPVSEFLSDNGKNFLGAANQIKKDQSEEDIPSKLNEIRHESQTHLAQKYALNWRFIPAYSPWFGGCYERLIREVKRAIEVTINERKVSKVTLNIAVQDAVQRINNRPLTYNSISHEDDQILTPHLLAKGRSGWPLLPSQSKVNSAPNNKEDKLIYHKGKAIADEIMRRFVSEYLTVLTKRDKWFKNVDDIKVDDLVILIDPDQTRKEWPRAKVIATYPGKDNRVRVVDLMFADRSIDKEVTVQRLAKINISKLNPEI